MNVMHCRSCNVNVDGGVYVRSKCIQSAVAWQSISATAAQRLARVKPSCSKVIQLRFKATDERIFCKSPVSCLLWHHTTSCVNKLNDTEGAVVKIQGL